MAFTLQRQQFPVHLCCATTINKSQGQTLDKVGVRFSKARVFARGDLCCHLKSDIEGGIKSTCAWWIWGANGGKKNSVPRGARSPLDVLYHTYVYLYGCSYSHDPVFLVHVSCIFSRLMFSFVALFSRVHFLLKKSSSLPLLPAAACPVVVWCRLFGVVGLAGAVRCRG